MEKALQRVALTKVIAVSLDSSHVYCTLILILLFLFLNLWSVLLLKIGCWFKETNSYFIDILLCHNNTSQMIQFMLEDQDAISKHIRICSAGGGLWRISDPYLSDRTLLILYTVYGQPARLHF